MTSSVLGDYFDSRICFVLFCFLPLIDSHKLFLNTRLPCLDGCVRFGAPFLRNFFNEKKLKLSCPPDLACCDWMSSASVFSDVFFHFKRVSADFSSQIREYERGARVL